MKEYEGMNFKKWCLLDPDDERVINYTLSGIMEGKKQTLKFTSEEEMNGLMLFRIQRSFIEKIELKNNEWFIELVTY